MKYQIVWKVAVKQSRFWIFTWCLFEHFSEALSDFKTHDEFRLIYPIIVSKEYFNTLQDFSGW